MEKKDCREKNVIDRNYASRVLKPVCCREKWFYFATGVGEYTGKIAFSLYDFSEKIKTVDVESINFHFSRQEFERWIRETLGDPEFAMQIKGIKGLKGEALREEIIQTVENRLNELAKAIPISEAHAIVS